MRRVVLPSVPSETVAVSTVTVVHRQAMYVKLAFDAHTFLTVRNVHNLDLCALREV